MNTNNLVPPNDGTGSDAGDKPESVSGVPPEKRAPEGEAPLGPPSSAQAGPAGPAPTNVADISTQKLIGEYLKTARWNSLIRSIFPLFVLAVIVVFILVTVMGVMSAFPEKRVTTETLRAGEELLPVLNQVLKSFAEEVAPQLAEEFERGVQKGADKLIQTLAEEIERLEKATREYVKLKVDESFANVLEDHEKLLAEVFPDLAASPEERAKLARRVNAAFKTWTVHYMLSMLEEYYLAMGKIQNTIKTSYAPKPGEAVAEAGQEADMLELFMELVNAAFSEEAQPGEPVPPEQAPPAAPAPGATPEAGGTEQPAQVAPAATNVVNQ